MEKIIKKIQDQITYEQGVILSEDDAKKVLEILQANRLEKLVMPKIADIKKEFEEQFCLIHTVEDYDNHWSYVDAKAAELWKFIEEKLSNFSA